jgi:hypothetical protein
MLLHGCASRRGTSLTRNRFSVRSELIESEAITELGIREDVRQEPVRD